MSREIDYIKVCTSWVSKLNQFLKDISYHEDNHYFHPHPFTYENALKIANYDGNDLYFLQTMDKVIVGYGMLRGWDEGFQVPSLGIIIHPTYRNQGFGKKFIEFLHNQARIKGSAKIRLKVYRDNTRALRLYKSLGYSFKNNSNQLIGYYKLLDQ
jgi:ribosomal protein S18 acetylase RimI-like enzyme